MANAIGVKIGDRETRDIVDIWALMPNEFNERAYFDPKAGEHDYKSLPEAVSVAAARNREAYARIAWSPYMHNPKLKHRLHRVNVPTLFVRGASDGIVSADYLARYAALIPQARIETLAQAGHLPQVEQPAATAAAVLQFLQGKQAAETSGARR
jgi:pimeloyl-ACP methyl ester carboxylesterase